MAGAGPASGQLSPPLNSYQWFQHDRERKQLQSLPVKRQATHGSTQKSENNIRTPARLPAELADPRPARQEDVALRRLNSTRSRRSVLKKFGRSWEFDAGSSHGGCKMFANPVQYQEMMSSAQLHSHEGSTEMNILNNYTGSASRANFIEVQDQTADGQAHATWTSAAGRGGDSKRQKKARRTSVASRDAQQVRDPYVMLTGLLDQLDARESSSTFVLPNR